MWWTHCWATKAAELLRIGFGEDSHALTAGKPLVLGGVKIDSDRGSVAHSDGDVLLHALADALLSAWALGDIGRLFPPGDPETVALDSSIIVERVLGLLAHSTKGRWRIANVAAVVTLDTPKLGAWREQIQTRVRELLDLPPSAVGVTFKTSEGLAPDHIQARVTVLLQADG